MFYLITIKNNIEFIFVFVFFFCLFFLETYAQLMVCMHYMGEMLYWNFFLHKCHTKRAQAQRVLKGPGLLRTMAPNSTLKRTEQSIESKFELIHSQWTHIMHGRSRPEEIRRSSLGLELCHSHQQPQQYASYPYQYLYLFRTHYLFKPNDVYVFGYIPRLGEK